MTTRIADDIWLTDAQCRSEAEGRREVIGGLAGRALILNELAQGRVVDPDGTRSTPFNPQGRIGVDCSGPPWGSAIRTPIAWKSGRKADTTSVLDQPNIGTALHSGGLVFPVVIGPWLIRNRPFERLPSPSVAPHSRGYITLRAHGVATETIDVVARAWNSTKGQTSSDGQQVSTSMSMTTSESAYDLGIFVDLDGGNNVINFALFPTEPTNGITICSIQIEQRAKRSH